MMETASLPAVVCIVLQGSLGIPVSVNVDFLEGSATFQDFSNRDTSLTFEAGSVGPQCIELDILVDGLLENEEQFSISLSSPNEVVDIVNGSLQVTVQDSTELEVGFVSPDGTVTEGETFMACVRIVSGQLAEQFVLPLSVEVSEGQGKLLFKQYSIPL